MVTEKNIISFLAISLVLLLLMFVVLFSITMIEIKKNQVLKEKVEESYEQGLRDGLDIKNAEELQENKAEIVRATFLIQKYHNSNN